MPSLPRRVKCQRDLHWFWSYPAFLLPSFGTSFLYCLNCSSSLCPSTTATPGLLSCALKIRFKIKPLSIAKPACGIWCQVWKCEMARRFRSAARGTAWRGWHVCRARFGSSKLRQGLKYITDMPLSSVVLVTRSAITQAMPQQWA